MTTKHPKPTEIDSDNPNRKYRLVKTGVYILEREAESLSMEEIDKLTRAYFFIGQYAKNPYRVILKETRSKKLLREIIDFLESPHRGFYSSK